MTKLIYTALVLTAFITLSINYAYSEENLSLPSENTWNEIQTTTTPSSELPAEKDIHKLSTLRAAPPDGPSIGETPNEGPSLIWLFIIGTVYLLFKSQRKYSSRN